MRRLIWVVLSVLLAGCVTQPEKKDLSAFQAASPRSVLIVPLVNKSLDVDAPNYVLATLPIPLAEKGYYVFPVNTTKYVLEQEGFYDGDRIHEQSAPAITKMFDADAVLYVTINRWDAKFILVSTEVTVEFEYRMVSRDGTEIWREKKQMKYTSGNSNAGLIGAVINAIATRVSPNYIPLAQTANRQVFVLGPSAIPDGPYLVSEKK
jgi:hypothetical protein